MGLSIKEWNGDAVKKLMHASLDKRMVAAGVLIVNDIKESLSAKDNIDHHHSSKPGEDPAKVRGDLVKSITYNYNPEKKRLAVGTNTLIGKYLELGTRHMAARPFLRNGWKRCKDKILSLFRDG